jgi:DNA-binding SARP family transcriptional activator
MGVEMPHQSWEGSGVRLSLLGRWQLDACPQSESLGDNARRLLALLALRGHMTRPQLAGTLWADADESSAGSRLRTVLWRLGPARRLLDETNGTLALAPFVGVDVSQLRAGALALDLELALDVSPGADDPVGVAIFEADLLPGWYDDWLVVDRERIRQLRLHGLEALATRRIRAGRYAAALDAALAAVREDPLRESAHRCVVGAHAAEGNVVEAMRQYERCREIFATELNIEPSPSLQTLLPVTLR